MKMTKTEKKQTKKIKKIRQTKQDKTRQKKIIVTTTLFFLFLISTIIFSLNVNADTIILNSKNWQDLYLASILAGKTNSNLLYFLNLGDAEIKTQTIRKNETIIILESKNPVVKNYYKVIEVNGFEKKPETIKYSDYNELQKIILENKFKTKTIKEKNKNLKKYFIIYDKYSLEALSAAPIILKEKYTVLFLNEKNIEEIKKIITHSNNIIIAGHIPVRTLKKLDYKKLLEEGKIKKEFLQYPIENSYNITKYFLKQNPTEWGILMTPERVDLYALQEKNPIFLYVGYLQELSNIIKDSKIDKFEIISGAIVNLAKELEKKSGRDLKLIVKYGRTVTKIKGLEGELLELDTIRTPYPYSELQIENAEYYTVKEKNETTGEEKSYNVILITYKNTGNVNTRFYSNVEYKGTALADNYTHKILVGEEFSIPYIITSEEQKNFLDKNKNGKEEIVINTKYDMNLPLKKNILNEEKIPIIIKKVDEKKIIEDNSNIQIEKVEYEDKRGKFIIKIKNEKEKPVKTKIEIIIDEENTFTSKNEILKGKEEKNIIIETPYFDKSKLDFKKNYLITAYYGEKNTIKQKSYNMKILEANIIGFTTTQATIGISLLVIIILIIILFLILKKKKKI